ncbi:hypothetical protein K2224_18180 [Streptomyces sp. BHT-5-2]|uniref:hypothetical protein n=1 Tax=unclassified Streptomyces TaxID=2593676 RepID=UPI001C8E23B4|nr:hypothetical protein [Streptomyces sp. BHT-5-2]QZL04831.1 hypothetical protein K2224_18180 [Streptomyces sp. BHT-5-2]
MPLAAPVVRLGDGWLVGEAVAGQLLAVPLLLGAAAAFAYGAGLATWHEGGRMRESYGEPWTAYRAAVPAWLPRFRPWHLERRHCLA